MKKDNMKKINNIGNTEYILSENTEFVYNVTSEKEENIKFDFNQSTKVLTILSKVTGDIVIECMKG